MPIQEPLDLRGVPVWERAATVLDRSSTLSPGETFEFKMELDPRALIARLEQQAPDELKYRAQRVAENEWRVAITRLNFSHDESLTSRALSRSPVFGALGGDALSLVLESLTERTARKGEVLCAENTPCPWLGIVLDGSLAVFAGTGSREQLLFQLFAFDVFGVAEFFDNGLCLGRTLVVSKSVRYATIPFGAIRDVAKRDPEFLMALGACCAQRARGMASTLAAQVSKPILVRVASALLPYAVPARGLEAALAPLPTMTQSQIAAAAGTVKEVAARAISELERLGAVRRERGHVRYLDRGKLLETAEA